jgi:glycosyltransferase involved in cell wall biosynthesis
MKTSVVIPAFNREDLIVAALRSLLRQADAVDLDIVVVDDGSTDRTAAAVAEVAAAAPQVRLLRQANAGPSAARNAGLAHLHPDSELVTFLDSDDISVAGRFAAGLPPFRDDPDLDMTYARMTLTDGIDIERLDVAAGALSCTMRGIQLSAALFRRRALERLGGFNPAMRFGEDVDLLLRFFEGRPRYRLVDEVALLYRRHPGNLTRDRAGAHRGFLQALLLSAQRRRRNPDVGEMPTFWDVSPLFDEAYASLR